MSDFGLGSIYKCTIHNIRYSHSDDKAAYHCPRCAHEENVALRNENALLKEHRDALLRAIEIKKTVEVVS